jgi:hypothetical protein
MMYVPGVDGTCKSTVYFREICEVRRPLIILTFCELEKVGPPITRNGEKLGNCRSGKGVLVKLTTSAVYLMRSPVYTLLAETLA